jgi:hypothetical protein
MSSGEGLGGITEYTVRCFSLQKVLRRQAAGYYGTEATNADGLYINSGLL